MSKKPIAKQPRPLEIYQDAELIDELSRRYLACVFVGEKAERIGSSTDLHYWWKGSTAWCYGLTSHISTRLATHLNCVREGDKSP
jgi:hypothetical protein